MSDGNEQDWQNRYQSWLEQVGLPDDAPAQKVYQTLIENRKKDNQDLVDHLEERIQNISDILKETPAERKTL